MAASAALDIIKGNWKTGTTAASAASVIIIVATIAKLTLPQLRKFLTQNKKASRGKKEKKMLNKLREQQLQLKAENTEESDCAPKGRTAKDSVLKIKEAIPVNTTTLREESPTVSDPQLKLPTQGGGNQGKKKNKKNKRQEEQLKSKPQASIPEAGKAAQEGVEESVVHEIQTVSVLLASLTTQDDEGEKKKKKKRKRKGKGKGQGGQLTTSTAVRDMAHNNEVDWGAADIRPSKVEPTRQIHHEATKYSVTRVHVIREEDIAGSVSSDEPTDFSAESNPVRHNRKPKNNFPEIAEMFSRTMDGRPLYPVSPAPTATKVEPVVNIPTATKVEPVVVTKYAYAESENEESEFDYDSDSSVEFILSETEPRHIDKETNPRAIRTQSSFSRSESSFVERIGPGNMTSSRASGTQLEAATVQTEGESGHISIEKLQAVQESADDQHHEADFADGEDEEAEYEEGGYGDDGDYEGYAEEYDGEYDEEEYWEEGQYMEENAKEAPAQAAGSEVLAPAQDETKGSTSAQKIPSSNIAAAPFQSIAAPKKTEEKVFFDYYDPLTWAKESNEETGSTRSFSDKVFMQPLGKDHGRRYTAKSTSPSVSTAAPAVPAASGMNKTKTKNKGNGKGKGKSEKLGFQFTILGDAEA
ncbi:hypothetical protein BJ878DRAFT_73904 [Calycina marina]|uniref:Uncharacterized protein n=1 Tax=Calycina marina TaxID=1763456 RepID=A0A9P8CF42_9HELO|nr:hypothetical protein BJ878DRAFT_73904 [Calycina marina]